jgi:pyruvate dehydrogenase E2 component (dihydrolipoamide acetyltransferase)
MLGGLSASLAIVPPQVAILGAGRIFDAVRPVDSEIRITKVLPLSLTFDHRVVTGAEAVRFLGAVIAELAAS